MTYISACAAFMLHTVCLTSHCYRDQALLRLSVAVVVLWCVLPCVCVFHCCCCLMVLWSVHMAVVRSWYEGAESEDWGGGGATKTLPCNVHPPTSNPLATGAGKFWYLWIWDGEIWCGENLAPLLKSHGKIWHRKPRLWHRNRGPQTVVDISYGPLVGCGCFVVACGWLLSFPGGLLVFLEASRGLLSLFLSKSTGTRGMYIPRALTATPRKMANNTMA